MKEETEIHGYLSPKGLHARVRSVATGEEIDILNDQIVICTIDFEKVAELNENNGTLDYIKRHF